MKNDEIKIRAARPQDCSDVALLLKMADLPIDDIDSNLVGFIVAFDNEQLVGTVGIEAYGELGLLRSLAVAQSHRNRQIGERLFQNALEYAKSRGIKNLYLQTTTADTYFAKRGFEVINRDAVPEVIKQTQQYSQICPDTAVIMWHPL